MDKITWSRNTKVQSISATYDAMEFVRTFKTIKSGDTVDYTVNQLKRNMFDIKSFGLWSQDIPEVKDLKVGDTFTVPHFTFAPYSGRRNEYEACNAVFRVLDKKTHKGVHEVLNADGTKFGKRKYQTTYVLIECDQDRYVGPDIWFERCSSFSARKENYGEYYPLKKKIQKWVTQKEILKMYLKDGGLCPIKRIGKDCKICDK